MKYELYIGKHCHTITGPDGLAIHFIANDLAEAERVARLMFAAVDDEAGRECDGQFGQLAMRLRRYNEWRRGADFEQPHPEELGELIDGVADRLEVLEREHAEFFERWHDERRKREALANDVERCYRMLLTEPDTKGALFKSENILREALAEANAKTHNPTMQRLVRCHELLGNY